jgi:hypothetical protein
MAGLFLFFSSACQLTTIMSTILAVSFVLVGTCGFLPDPKDFVKAKRPVPTGCRPFFELVS